MWEKDIIVGCELGERKEAYQVEDTQIQSIIDGSELGINEAAQLTDGRQKLC